MKFIIRTILLYIMPALLLSPVIAHAQVPNQRPQSSLTGKYEGRVKDSTGEAKIALEIVEDAEKISGSITTGLGVFKIVNGQFVDGALTLEVETKGSPQKISVRQKDDWWVGTATDAGKTPEITFRKVKADDISGEWDAAADVQGQAFPFTLSLKLDGEKVTGTSSSQLGDAPISSGVWKEGKLALVLDGPNGATALLATLVDGKLVGDYDYAGQVQGKWVAIKKK